MKEQKVYVVSADNDEISISGYDIENWLAFAQDNNELLPEAIEFIKIAENEGSVYSLHGFQMAFNLDEFIGMNDWIFITNLY